ncbi:YcgL domain-containing protein [Aliidiomarina sp. Khilg15.8]
MLCTVIKSHKKADTYLYLPQDAPFDELPEPLQQLFTPHTEVTVLNITPTRKLARFRGDELLTHLNTDGYYLQIPQTPTNWLEDYKTRTRDTGAKP